MKTYVRRISIPITPAMDLFLTENKDTIASDPWFRRTAFEEGLAALLQAAKDQPIGLYPRCHLRLVRVDAPRRLDEYREALQNAEKVLESVSNPEGT